jgi:hypothetical protein
MKKALLLLSLILLFFLANAQSANFLTVRQVFDFEIGDEFHYTFYNQPSSYPYDGLVRNITEVITNKKVGNDSVVYTYSRKTKERKTCPCPHTLDSTIYTITYTHLDSLVTKTILPSKDLGQCRSCPNNNNCKDTSFLSPDFNNRTVNYTKHTSLTWGQVRFVEGMGLHYYYLSADLSFGRSITSLQLEYYKSAKTNEEWGNKLNMVGIEQVSEQELVNVYPNPFTENISISFANNLNQKKYDIKLTDNLGNIVKTIPLEQTTVINVQPLDKGIYTLIVYGNGVIVCNKRIVKL